MAVFSRWRREGRRPSGGIGDIERTDGTTLLEVLETLANIAIDNALRGEWYPPPLHGGRIPLEYGPDICTIYTQRTI